MNEPGNGRPPETTIEEQFAAALQLRHSYERQLAGNVAWIQAGEFWLDRHRLLCEARCAVRPPEPPRPTLPDLASAQTRLEYARELNDHLWLLLGYQRAIMAAQFVTAFKHGEACQFARYRGAQAARIDDWLAYEPSLEGMADTEGSRAGTPALQEPAESRRSEGGAR